MTTPNTEAVVPPAAGSLRLFEISALLSCHAVILAESKEAAFEQVETWEGAWHRTGELIGVSDVDLFEVRPMKSSLLHWQDEAHDYSPKAGEAITAAIKAHLGSEDTAMEAGNGSAVSPGGA